MAREILKNENCLHLFITKYVLKQGGICNFCEVGNSTSN
jgi:hypothetical protein